MSGFIFSKYQFFLQKVPNRPRKYQTNLYPPIFSKNSSVLLNNLFRILKKSSIFFFKNFFFADIRFKFTWKRTKMQLFGQSTKLLTNLVQSTKKSTKLTKVPNGSRKYQISGIWYLKYQIWQPWSLLSILDNTGCLHGGLETSWGRSFILPF